MIHMYIEIDIDADKYLYQMLFDNTSMLSLSCKLMILITLNMPKI
jgi:hypothetical protein